MLGVANRGCQPARRKRSSSKPRTHGIIARRVVRRVERENLCTTRCSRHPEPRRRRRISKWQAFSHPEILRRASPTQDDDLCRGSRVLSSRNRYHLACQRPHRKVFDQLVELLHGSSLEDQRQLHRSGCFRRDLPSTDDVRAWIVDMKPASDTAPASGSLESISCAETAAAPVVAG